MRTSPFLCKKKLYSVYSLTVQRFSVLHPAKDLVFTEG